GRQSAAACLPAGPGARNPPLHGNGGLATLAPRVGFEPTTLRLTAGCSTIELPRNDGAGSAASAAPPRFAEGGAVYWAVSKAVKAMRRRRFAMPAGARERAARSPDDSARGGARDARAPPPAGT